MKEIDLTQLFYLANYAGGRFDLVQAGGGNVSWQAPQGELFIKTSGIALSEMRSIEQCACLDTQQVLAILHAASVRAETSKQGRERIAQSLLLEANHTLSQRPSIETFLHVMLFAFTLHTHPLAVNHLVMQKNAKQMIEKYFPESLFVDYATPGIELALELHDALHAASYRPMQAKEKSAIVFLKNHGLIVSADTAEAVVHLTEQTVQRIEKIVDINYERYRVATRIAALFHELTDSYKVAWLSEDQTIQTILQECPELLFMLPASPDAFVFNGFMPCLLTALTIVELQNYFTQWGIYPKVIYYQNHLYFINHTVKKARDMEEIFKFHVMALRYVTGDIAELPHDELRYLANWEAEKYRQQR